MDTLEEAINIFEQQGFVKSYDKPKVDVKADPTKVTDPQAYAESMEVTEDNRCEFYKEMHPQSLEQRYIVNGSFNSDNHQYNFWLSHQSAIPKLAKPDQGWEVNANFLLERLKAKSDLPEGVQIDVGRAWMHIEPKVSLKGDNFYQTYLNFNKALKELGYIPDEECL